MCPGEANRIFAKTDGDIVLEFDTSGQGIDGKWEHFTQLRKIKIGFDMALGLCFVTSPKNILILSSPRRIWAVSCDTNKIMWQIEGKICPYSLLFLPETNLVLASDGKNSKNIGSGS